MLRPVNDFLGEAPARSGSLESIERAPHVRGEVLGVPAGFSAAGRAPPGPGLRRRGDAPSRWDDGPPDGPRTTGWAGRGRPPAGRGARAPVSAPIPRSLPER